MDGSSSVELYATAAHEIGDATLKVGGSYIPHQSKLGGDDGSYLFMEAVKPLPVLPVAVRGRLGREGDINTPIGSTKIDYLLGIDVHPGPVMLSVAWVAARNRARL